MVALLQVCRFVRVQLRCVCVVLVRVYICVFCARVRVCACVAPFVSAFTSTGSLFVCLQVLAVLVCECSWWLIPSVLSLPVTPSCSIMSRADFWVLAAQTMMVEACPYSSTRRGSTSGVTLTLDPTVNRCSRAHVCVLVAVAHDVVVVVIMLCWGLFRLSFAALVRLPRVFGPSYRPSAVAQTRTYACTSTHARVSPARIPACTHLHRSHPLVVFLSVCLFFSPPLAPSLSLSLSRTRSHSSAYSPALINTHIHTHAPARSPHHRRRALLKGSALHDHVVFPFLYGREDRANCSYNYTTDQRLADPERGSSQIVTFLQACACLPVRPGRCCVCLYFPVFGRVCLCLPECATSCVCLYVCLVVCPLTVCQLCMRAVFSIFGCK